MKCRNFKQRPFFRLINAPNFENKKHFWNFLTFNKISECNVNQFGHNNMCLH